MKKYLLWAFGLLVLVPVFLSSCSTSSKAVKEDVGKDPQVLSGEGVTLKLRYLDVKALYTLYNNRNNPFLYYSSGTLTVFDLNVTSDKPVQLNLKDMQLSSDKGTRTYVSKQTLASFWDTRLTTVKTSRSNGRSDYSNWSRGTVLDTIDKQMYPDVVSVPAGSETSGHVAFEIIRGAKNGKLSIPVKDSEGKLVHEFTYEFSF